MKRLTLLSAALVGVTAFMTPSHPPVVADAAERGDLNQVKALIKQGADVNVAQGDGMTPLHWAAEHGDAAMTEALLKAHAKVAAATRIGNYTPLHLASRGGYAAVVSDLLNAGADANAATLSGATPLHLAAAAGSADAVKALLAHHANPNAKENDWGQTPLIFAAEYNRADAIRALIQGGADPTVHTSAVNLTEQAARDQAAARRRNEVLLSYLPPAERDSLIKAAARNAGGRGFGGGGGGGGFGGAAPGTVANPDSQLAANAAAAPARGGRAAVPTPPTNTMTSAQIQAAIDSGRKVLLADQGKGPMVEEVDTINGGVAGYVGSVGGMGGLTALHHAARQGNTAAAIALIEGGASINDTSLADHTTPLLMAAINGQFDVAMELVRHHADPNIPNKFGDTPLNATINQQWSPKSRYPQPEAIQNQKTTYLELMTALLDAGANPNSRMKSQPWYFVFNNCGNANCGLENIEGATPFWRAAYAVDVDAMKILMAHGADPNIPTQRMAPLVAAGRRGGRGGRGAPGDSAGVATTLAAAGGGGGGRGGRGGGAGGPPPPPPIDSMARVAPVGLGVYPIHAVAGVGYGNGFAGNSHRHAPDGWMPAMRYMVEVLHADVNARDQSGFTPLHHAAARGDNEMILYLVAHGADVKAVSRTGKTTVDMANGPVQRLRPYPETIALLEKLGAVNTHRCVSC